MLGGRGTTTKGAKPLVESNVDGVDRSTALYVGKDLASYHDDQDDEEEVSDDPPWYNVPRASLQAPIPASVMRKTSSSNIELDFDPASSPNNAPHQHRKSKSSRKAAATKRSSSPTTSDESGRSSGGGHRSSGSGRPKGLVVPKPKKHLLMKNRLSIKKSKLESTSDETDKKITNDNAKAKLAKPVRSPPPPPSAPHSGPVRASVPDAPGSGPVVRESLIALQEAQSSEEALTSSGVRESILQYRPSDLHDADVQTNFIVRDSLAVLQEDAIKELKKGRATGGRLTLTAVEDNLSEFLKAAKEGNVMVVNACLHDRDLDISQRDPVHGQTALHFAVRYGRLQVVRLLCQKKCRRVLIDAVDDRQNTPLHLAAAKSRRITKFLLEHGASVTKLNNRDQTPLGVHIVTAKRDDPLLAEMLLQHKSDANSTVDGSTLLHKAVDLSLCEIALRLVRYGARLDLKDENGRMVFDKVNRKVLRQLFTKISYPPVWVPDEDRPSCMLCTRKFSRFAIGVRRHHCRHCGRICCGQCSDVCVESVDFPKTFQDRFQKGGARKNRTLKRVCRTCSIVFRERNKPQEEKNLSTQFVQKVMGCEWEEVGGQHNAPRASHS